MFVYRTLIEALGTYAAPAFLAQNFIIDLCLDVDYKILLLFTENIVYAKFILNPRA